MTELYLIRHTQAEGNLYRMMQGHWDGDITLLGQKQIDALAERFRSIPLDAVYSSDLRRAMLTAEGAARYSSCCVQTDPRLRECNVGPWEGRFFGNISYVQPKEIELFMHSPGDWKIEGAETLADVTERAYPALVEIAEKHAGQTVAVVSHGITIRCLLSQILNRPLSGQEPVPIAKNTAVTKLIYENGTFSAEYIADASHVAHLMVTDWIANDGLRDTPFCPETDLDLYKQCYADAWSNAHNGDLSHFSADSYAASALAHLHAHPDSVRKFYTGEEFVGLIDMDPAHGKDSGYGWISFLYLVPQYRNKGYGIQLLGRAVVLYRKLGRTSLRLYAAEDNRAALRFYEKSGFRTLRTEAGNSGNLYLMEKAIAGGK